MVFMAEGGFDIDNWPHLAAWAGRLKAIPGFALSYELIPSNDREFDIRLDQIRRRLTRIDAIETCASGSPRTPKRALTM
jgi:hypothetical protein